MPPWENVRFTELTCQQCGAPFRAKRPTAKYCSDLCVSRGRPKRTPPTAEQRRQWRLARLEKPGHRERVNAAANERIRAVKAWINAYKVDQGCVDCGYRANPVALDIDHMNGKTANIANLKSIEAVKAEIDRHGCVVRCANCHRIKSWETRTWVRHESPETAS
jgi:hypothetical protein